MESFSLFAENVTPHTEHEALVMYQYGKPLEEIRSHLKISTGSLYRILEKNGIRPHRQNVTDKHQRLSDFHAAGVPMDKLSDFFGYSNKYMEKILRNGRRNILS